MAKGFLYSLFLNFLSTNFYKSTVDWSNNENTRERSVFNIACQKEASELIDVGHIAMDVEEA